MVLEFINKLDIRLGTYVFAIATCGGSVGNALGQLEEALNSKGTSLAASYKIKMPDNYQIMYSPPPEEKRNQLFKAQEEKIVDIVKDIKNQVNRKLDDEGSMKRIFGGIVYRVFDPYGLGINFWADVKCNGCGICERVCPADNISMNEDKPCWRHKCELCLACMHWCPQRSIQYKKGTIKRERYQHPKIKVNELFKE